MPEIPSLLEKSLSFDPAGDFEAFLKKAPAKWAVYLLSDADDRPVQLLCVRNLRMSLKRRLSGEEASAGLSRRVDYRELVRRIHWRRVDSTLEADWIYYDAARTVFPTMYRGMVGFRPAWFIHVNPQTNFPRYTKTIDLSSSTGQLLGPLEDKHAAARLIHLLEDSFDLCRYYNILIEAPNARACAYKEMGRCPAPCDGTISMPQYRRMIEWSLQTLIDPAPFLREHTRRMEQAAAELKFESAARIKAFIAQMSQLGKGAFRHVRRLEDFVYVCLQHGHCAGAAKVFLITPGRIEQIASLTSDPAPAAPLLRTILAVADERKTARVTPEGAERVGIVAHHLFSPRQSQGVFIPLEKIDEKFLSRAYRDLTRQSLPQDFESEGVMKELQTL